MQTGALVSFAQPTRELRLKLWQEALIDLLVQKPGMKIKELAAAIGKRPDTVSMILRSNMFQARLALRRDEHSRLVSYTLIAKQQGLVENVLDQLKDKLEENAVTKKISARDLSDIAGEMLDRIGLGARPADVVVNTSVQNNTTSVTVSGDALMRARAKLRNNEDILQRDPRAELLVDAMVSESARAPILDELMSIGDPTDGSEGSPEGEKSGASALDTVPDKLVPSSGRAEGEG